MKTQNGKRTDYFWIPREGVDFGYAVEHPLVHVETIKDKFSIYTKISYKENHSK